MKKVLILGIVAIFLGMALVNGVLSLQEKGIESNEFSVGSPEDYVNITEASLEITEQEGMLFNNEGSIFVHNNATYDGLSFEITGSDLNDVYPEGVALDLGDNGRDEYRFDGWSVGQWGNQSNMINDLWESRTSHDAFPVPEGDMYYVKLPSRAVVTDVNMDLEHPLIPVVQEGYFEDDNLDIANSYYYYYGYEYSWGYKYEYGYSYYYPTSYWENYNYASQFRYSYPGYQYSSYGNTYKGGQPDSTVHMTWELDDPAFSVPQGANILKYELNYPVRNYAGYAGSYGYTWTSNSARYYGGERTYGVFEALEPQLTDDDMNYYYSYYDYYYNQERLPDLEEDTIDEYYYDLYPGYDPTVIDEYTLDEFFSNSYYKDEFMPVYDLSDLASDWIDGTTENNGIMLAMYDTPYGTMPYDGGVDDDFVYINDAGSYSGARQQNNYQFYYGGYLYNPLCSYYANNYGHLYPKLIISYDLASYDPWLDFGDDGVNEYTHVGELYEPISVGGTPAFNNAINTYLATHLPDEVDDYGNEFTYVPIRLGAESAGKIVIDNIKIRYDYTALVYYNPTTGTTLDELNSLVPSDEIGWSLIPINLTADSQGIIELDNLQILGSKPNYRPTVKEVIVPSVEEGIIDPMWLEITQFFEDMDQDVSTLDYRVNSNDMGSHVELFIYRPETRAGEVYLGIDTSIDENWFGDVQVVISAMDDGGKDIMTDPFTITIDPVNDLPYMDMELPEITGEEGIDPILIEYNAPTGRDVAMGKVSFLMAADGVPYYMDIEDERIYLGFQLLDGEMNEATLETSNDDGFKIYRGANGELSLTILPPEYTEDPDNFIVIIGSNPDYNMEYGMYYLRVFTSDDPNDIYGQTYETVPITIAPVNDPPLISVVPDVVLDEDTSYSGTVDFIDMYLSDIDSPMSELSVMFYPSEDEVEIVLDNDNHLQVDVAMDFYGVVPVTVEATDGESSVFSTFNVRIRSINDMPKVVVSNVFESMVIDDMFYIRGTANDIEKDLRWVEVGVVEKGGFLYEDDWGIADGAYVWQYLMDIRDLRTAEYEVFIRAYDGRDYSEVLEFVVNVKTPEPEKPSPAPEVTITTTFDDVLSDKVEVSGTVFDESGYVDFVEFRIDGGIWKKAALDVDAWTALINTRIFTNDNHNLSVRAYDGKSYSEIEFSRFEIFNEDSDLDGISNEWENILQLDPFNPLDGTMDFDEDGFSNAEEVAANTDIFDGLSHPAEDDGKSAIDTWALIFIAVAIISAIVIIALFILNIRIEKNMHGWREDLHRRRAERRPKTLLQKIVEMTPIFGGAAMAPAGPALPGGAESGPDVAALPPAQEGFDQPPQ